MMKDYYQILGLNSSASSEEIKSAYKRLAKQWHPDRWRNSSDFERLQAEEKMKDINEAYEVLKNSTTSISSSTRKYSWKSTEDSTSKNKSKYAKEDDIWDVDLDTLVNPYRNNKTNDKNKTESNKPNGSYWFDSDEITKDFFGI